MMFTRPKRNGRLRVTNRPAGLALDDLAVRLLAQVHFHVARIGAGQLKRQIAKRVPAEVDEEMPVARPHDAGGR